MSTALAVIAIVIGIGGSAFCAWAIRRKHLGSGLVLAVAVAGTLAIGGVLSVLVLSEGLFAGVHLGYLVGVIAVPMVGAATAISVVGQGRRATFAAALLVAVVPAAIGVYATHVAPFDLRSDDVDLAVAAERLGGEGLRIAVISDLQIASLGDYERDAIAEVQAAEPDIILIAGDLFQGSPAQFEQVHEEYGELLGSLDAPGGVFAVRGDVDGDAARVSTLLADTEIELLQDEVAETEVRGTKVVVGGVRLDWHTSAGDAVLASLEATPDDTLAILLSHRPDTVLDLPADSRIDLVAAGHTHGGQIALPWYGPLTDLSRVPPAVGAGGLHEVAGNPIYVSTGIGVERDLAPQVRFLTHPSFGIIDVAAAEAAGS